jgi:hypothetical protein
MIENWRVIIFRAYSVRIQLGQLIASLIAAWYAKDVRLLIPAALAVAAIIARIIPQPALHATESLKDVGKD